MTEGRTSSCLDPFGTRDRATRPMCGCVLLCTTGVLSQAIVFLVVGEMSSQYDAAIVFGPGIVLFFCPLLHQSPTTYVDGRLFTESSECWRAVYENTT